MITVKEIYDFLDLLAPFNSAMEFDNCGILIGDQSSKAEKVLISLDVTSEVCEEARQIGANLIISHHPVIFKPLKYIRTNKVIYNLIKYDLNVICAHTNLDVAERGVNFYLAKALELTSLKPLSYFKAYPLGFIGNLKLKMAPKEFALFVKNKLQCEGVRYTECQRNISKVAACSGSGGDLISKAIEGHVDAFVTGEIKHSQILEANQSNILVVDAGHFKTENLVIPPLLKSLEEKFANISFYISQVFTDKIKYL